MIRPLVHAASLVGATAALAACTGIIPGTAPHDVRYDAAALERDRCDRSPVDPRLYGAAVVQKAEPLYRFVMGGRTEASRIWRARSSNCDRWSGSPWSCSNALSCAARRR